MWSRKGNYRQFSIKLGCFASIRTERDEDNEFGLIEDGFNLDGEVGYW